MVAGWFLSILSLDLKLVYYQSLTPTWPWLFLLFAHPCTDAWLASDFPSFSLYHFKISHPPNQAKIPHLWILRGQKDAIFILRSVLGSQGCLVFDFIFCVSFIVVFLFVVIYSVFGQPELFRNFFLGSFGGSTYEVHSLVLVPQLGSTGTDSSVAKVPALSSASYPAGFGLQPLSCLCLRLSSVKWGNDSVRTS